MNGHEFLRKLRRIARANKIAVRYDGKPGKGSHGRIYYGAAFTTVKDRTKEIGPGLYSKMLADLGLEKDDMKIAYPAMFEADEAARILVTLRDLPEAATDGADIHEARSEAADLLDSALMFRMKYREDVPAPSKKRKGEEIIAPDTAVAMKIALYLAMQNLDITAAELSRHLDVDYREAQRILNPHHATKTARISEAIEATGSRAVIDLQLA